MAKLVTWNAVSDLNAWLSKYDRNIWKSDGYVEIRNARTGQVLPMGHTYLKDLEDKNIDVLREAAKVTQPWVIVHAENDEAVPLTSAESLHRAGPNSQLKVISDTGHTFGGAHPAQDDGLPAKLLEAIHVSFPEKNIS